MPGSEPEIPETPETAKQPEPRSDVGPGLDTDSGRVRPRQNVVSARSIGFRKRFEGVGYWTLLAIVLGLLIWFISASARSSSIARDAEATVIATLFVPETATAVAEQETATAR